MINSHSKQHMSFQSVLLATLVCALGGLLSCQAPLVGGQTTRSNIQLKFLVQGQTVTGQGTVQNGASSRLLLPTAQTVTVAISPLAAGLSEARSVSATIAGGSAVVSIPDLIPGKYAVQAEAIDAAGVAVFRQSSDIEIQIDTAAIILNMVPVSSAGLNSLVIDGGQTLDLPAQQSASWIVPATGLREGKYVIEFAAAPSASLQVYAQSATGTSLPIRISGQAIVVSVPDGKASFLTFYNSLALGQPNISAPFTHREAVYTKVYNSPGFYPLTLPNCPTTVHVKAWGAGGAGSTYGGGGYGGAGGYADAVFPALAGQQLFVVVGTGGNRVVSGAVPAEGGANYTDGGTGGAGGGASLATLYALGNHTLMVCAGGGGGSPGSSICGSAGGGPAGQTESEHGTLGGSAGVGGNGGAGNSGSNMTLTSTGLTDFGGWGASAANFGSGGGGGGYGGGASNGNGALYYAGAGGGGYSVGGVTITGNYYDPPPQNHDADYVSGVAIAGSAEAPGYGGDGLVVVTISY